MPTGADGSAPSWIEDAVGPEAPVRRWEYVVLVRTSRDFADAATRAEQAAIEAGAAVLDSFRDSSEGPTSDYRYLLRTREEVAIGTVLARMRRQPGVLGAATVQLPETPTFPGGPSFLTAYTTDEGRDGSSGVIVHRDIPPVLDKRDLLEVVPVPTGPEIDTAGTGGFSLNLSKMMSALKAWSWRKREQKMKDAELPILPEDEDGSAAPSNPTPAQGP